MAKTLEQLMKQKKFSGKDVGILYLYSLKSDIESAENGLIPSPPFSQEFFDKAFESMDETEKEIEDWQLYKRLESKYYRQKQDLQEYELQFNYFSNEIKTTFNEIERTDNLLIYLQNKNLPEDIYNKIASEVLSISNLFEEKNVQRLSLLLDAIFQIKDILIRFYCVNLVYKEAFEKFDVPFMISTLTDVHKFEDEIKKINAVYNRILEKNISSRIIQKLGRLYEPVEDFSILYPSKEPDDFVISDKNYNDFSNTDIAYIENLSTTIDYLAMKVKEKNGLY